MKAKPCLFRFAKMMRRLGLLNRDVVMALWVISLKLKLEE